MPWRNVSTMEQKIAFIHEWKSGKFTFQSLCEAYGISRALGYRLCRRYKSEGEQGLLPRSRAPKTLHNRTLTSVEMAICDLRLKYPSMGADKILTVLRQEGRFPETDLPAVSTGNLILKRMGLVKERKRFRRVEPVHPIFDPKEPNEVWSADFKGQFKMGNQLKCYPLTIADSFSRFLFMAKGLYSPNLEGCFKGFEQAFREYGLPNQIHTDNGLPFGCVSSLCRLTQLSVWFIELGIEPVYSDPGHPEQNGRHERMHRELKGEATRPPGFDLRAQQRKLNKFIRYYNEIRPHDACGKVPPGKVHVASSRKYPEKIERWEYPKEYRERYVCRNGVIRWGHDQYVMVSTSLKEKMVGLEEVGDGVWRLYFRQKMLGYFDEKTLRIQEGSGEKEAN